MAKSIEDWVKADEAHIAEGRKHWEELLKQTEANIKLMNKLKPDAVRGVKYGEAEYRLCIGLSNVNWKNGYPTATAKDDKKAA